MRLRLHQAVNKPLVIYGHYSPKGKRNSPFLPSPLHSPPVSQGRGPPCPPPPLPLPLSACFHPLLSSSPSEGLSHLPACSPLPIPLSCPSFSPSPFPTPLPGPLSPPRRKEPGNGRGCWGSLRAHRAGRAHPIPPAQGRRLGRCTEGPATGNSLGLPEPPRPYVPSQGLEQQRGQRIPLPSLCSNCPSLESQEGHCIWPEQNF